MTLGILPNVYNCICSGTSKLRISITTAKFTYVAQIYVAPFAFHEFFNPIVHIFIRGLNLYEVLRNMGHFDFLFEIKFSFLPFFNSISWKKEVEI